MRLRALLLVTALFAGLVLSAAPSDAATPACSVVEQLTSSTGGNTASAAVDADGDRVVFRSDRDLTGDNADHSLEIFLADRTADTLIQITDLDPGDSAYTPSIDDAGARVAFVANNDPLTTNADLSDELFVYVVSGATLGQRTSAPNDTLNSADPALSGDGTKIAFLSSADLTGGNPDANEEIFLVNVTGPPAFSQLTNDNVGSAQSPVISQSGTRVAFASSENLVPATGNADGNTEIFMVDPSGPTTVQLTTSTGAGNTTPSMTDDGSRVVFKSQQDYTGANPDSSFELFRRVVLGGFTQLTDTTGGTTTPVVDATGARLAFASGSPDLPGSATSTDVYVSDLTPAGISSVSDVPVGRSAAGPTMTDDGEVIAFSSSADILGTNADANSEIFIARCGPKAPIFTDVPATNAFFGSIQWMSELEIASGFPGPTYRPADPVKRQQMANFMYNLAGQPAFTPPGTPTFNDVPTTNPFYLQIEWMVDEGIASGFPGGLFKPNDAVKRQQMANFMYNLAGQPLFSAPGGPTFNDVPASNPFFAQIEWMFAESVAGGFPGPTYRPLDPVNRQQMANFMHNFAVFVGVDLS